MIVPIDLADKNIDLENTAKIAAADPGLLQQLLAGIAPENHNASLRYNCFRVLMRLAESYPQLLLPHWDLFVTELHDPRADQQYIGIRLLALLIAWDSQHKFDSIFNLYFDMLAAPGLINANQVAGLAGQIALARNDLEPKITKRLLAINNPQLDAIRNGLVKSYALESLSAYFHLIKEPEPVLEFARGLLTNPSPRAKKTAKAFLISHP